MLRLFHFNRQKAGPPPVELLPQGYTPVLSARELLQPDSRRQLLERIWAHTALSRSQFEQLYLDPLQRYAERVQLLPASEAHHHAYPGGLLDHGLELVACSLKLRQSHLLPSGLAPEDQAAQADGWSAAIAYAALLHDIGKIAVDLEVEQLDGRRWHPWHGPLQQPYRFRYRPGRDYRLHGAAVGLLYTQVLDGPILDWLSGFPQLWGCLLYALAGQYERAGVLGELVSQADRVSTARNIGANPEKALQAPTHALQHHLLRGLRHLLQHELKLNQPGAAGWLTEDSLWLVSKPATDKLRAWLLAQSVEGIPSSNLALFDELQSHGLVQPTPEGKAIWSARIEDGDWQQTFTLLRLQPSLIWEPQARPAAFAGQVVIGNAAVSPPTPSAPHAPEPEPAANPAPRTQPPEHASVTHSTDSADAPQPDPAAVWPPADNPGQAFLDWLKASIASHQLIINDSQAKVHTVAGAAFLVTPGLFQYYCAAFPGVVNGLSGDAAWHSLQKRFEALRLHRKHPSGQNIWHCRVQGPRKSGTLKGYLIDPAERLFATAPPDNPFLRLIEGDDRP